VLLLMAAFYRAASCSAINRLLNGPETAEGSAENLTLWSSIVGGIIEHPAWRSAMRHTQAEINLAHQHVSDGDRLVAAQRRLILRLHDQGHPIAEAEELLRLMLSILEQMRDHLREMTKDDL
jgi:hypothetical protein